MRNSSLSGAESSFSAVLTSTEIVSRSDVEGVQPERPDGIRDGRNNPLDWARSANQAAAVDCASILAIRAGGGVGGVFRLFPLLFPQSAFPLILIGVESETADPSASLGMTKGRVALWCGFVTGWDTQVPPLRATRSGRDDNSFGRNLCVRREWNFSKLRTGAMVHHRQEIRQERIVFPKTLDAIASDRPRALFPRLTSPEPQNISQTE